MESFNDLSIRDRKVGEETSANNSTCDQKHTKIDDEADDSNWKTDEGSGRRIILEGDQDDEI